MPNINAAKKALRQTKKRTTRNDAKKKKIKELTKQFTKALAASPADAAAMISQVIQALDKAAKTNTIHRNKAARHKSALQRKLNALLKK
ncbi:MAG: 30S ribosomal protein S20 [Candidatus Kerfeldbacteria bacterium]|nr:30S ribosomal protein S20 [Candidatus Kerfeldbacteria bacterium]